MAETNSAQGPIPIRTWVLDPSYMLGLVAPEPDMDSMDEYGEPVKYEVIELGPVLELLERWVEFDMNTGALIDSEALLREHGRLQS